MTRKKKNPSPESVPIIRYLDKTPKTPCPYGDVQRIVTGGEGQANVHVVSVTRGSEHYHRQYGETYYFLSGAGDLILDGTTFPVREGTVAVIPAGMVHALSSNSDTPLKFIIFGTPPMSIEDERAKPVKPSSTENL